MAIDRSKFSRAGLGAALQHSNSTVDQKAGFNGYLVDLPRPRFGKIPVGAFVFDVIPFIAAKDFGTAIRKGSQQYVLDLWAHTNVGVNNDTVVCPSATLGQRCPICEERARLESSGVPFDEWKKFRPKRRVVYNIWVHDPSRAEENKGVQILEGAHFSFENNIQGIARNPITMEYIYFMDVDNGKSIAMTRTGSGATDTKYSGFQFVDRRGPIPDAILEQAIPLESYVKVLSYEELRQRAFPGIDELQKPEEPACAAPVYGQNPVYAAPSAPVHQQAPVQTATQAHNRCPMADIGGVFGASFDKLPQCAACDTFDECALEHDRQHG